MFLILLYKYSYYQEYNRPKTEISLQQFNIFIIFRITENEKKKISFLKKKKKYDDNNNTVCILILV